jgi:signal transduction histidine kinase
MYDVVHSMMQRLRPSVLDDLGLVAALEEEIEAWQARFPHINCSFSRDGELMGLGERINITLYRIVQESLTNIAKHADATQVTLKLARQQQTLTLSIEDNGCGMDTENPGRGLGLIGMRERVEALSGALSVQSAPGKGVTIRVSIPLDK